MKKIIYTLTFFYGLLAAGHAQNQVVVSGTVRSEEGFPLAGASISADETVLASADSNGFYTLICPQPPQVVQARYPGYWVKREKIEASAFSQGQIQIDFILDSRHPVLKEVVISATPIETIVEEDFTTDIYDFDFIGEHILLLMRERKRSLLRVIDESGALLSELDLPEKAYTLHSGCTGDLHVIGEQSVRELTLSNGRIDTLPAYSLALFRKFVGPCAQQASGYYYFMQRGLLNQSLRYTVFKEGAPPRVAFDIRYDKGLRYARAAILDFMRGKEMIFRTDAFNFRSDSPPEGASMGEGAATGYSDRIEELLQLACHECYDQMHRLAEIETIRRDSIYAPLLKLSGDTLCLFDHVNGQMLRFTPDMTHQNALPIDYHKEKGWRKLLLHDLAAQRAYARFERRGGLILKEINLHNGSVGAVYDLQIAPYLSEKFKIRNGLLYFLGQPDINIPNRMLYKMNIYAYRKK